MKIFSGLRKLWRELMIMRGLIRNGWRQVPLPNRAGQLYVKAGTHGKVYVEHTPEQAHMKQFGLDWAAGKYKKQPPL